MPGPYGVAMDPVSVEATAKSQEGRTFVVVARAAAAVGIPLEQEIRLRVQAQYGEATMSIRTRYTDLGDKGAVPRELWFEIYLPAPSLGDAMREAGDKAGTICALLALTANAAIDLVNLEIAFDASPDRLEHEFWQQLLADESGPPRLLREPEAQDFISVLTAFHSYPGRSRLIRAIAQYLEALRNAEPGREVLSLAHMWMAMEALTPLARSEQIQQAGSRELLLQMWGVELKVLDAEVRRRVLFQGDHSAYADAKKASDGFEHGYLDVPEVRNLSADRYRVVGKYVRTAILQALALQPDLFAKLTQGKIETALSCRPIAKYVHATLIGPVDKLAHGSRQYPMFQMHSALRGARTQADGSLSIDIDAKVTALLGENASYRDARIEYWGPEIGTAMRATPEGQPLATDLT